MYTKNAYLVFPLYGRKCEELSNKDYIRKKDEK